MIFIVRLGIFAACASISFAAAAEPTQIAMAEQREPGELVFVILTKHKNGSSYATSKGMGLLEFSVRQPILETEFDIVLSYFADDSLENYRVQITDDASVLSNDHYTLSLKTGGTQIEFFAVPIADQASGLDAVEAFRKFLPPDYRSRRRIIGTD